MRQALVLSALLLTACGPRILDPRPPAATATPVERMIVLDARGRTVVLPPGLAVDDAQKDKKGRIKRALVVEAPWERVADFSLEAEFGALGLFSDDEVARALVAEAARLGSDAVVLLPHGQAVALHGSLTPSALAAAEASPGSTAPAGSAAAPLSAAPPERAATVLDQELRTLGFAPLGTPARIDLAAPAPLELSVRRGQCLALALALEPEARLRPELSPSVLVEQRPTLARRGQAPPFELVEQKFAERRRLAAEVGCALADGRVTVSFDVKEALGTGTALLTLGELRPSDAELKEITRRHRELEKLRTQDSADEKASCATCDGAIEGAKGKREDNSAWRACLKLNGLKAADCP